MHSGVFISFEGIDGAGKSTHIDALAALLRSRGRTVAVTREPGGTPLAEKLRAAILNDLMDPLTEALLVFAARRDHLLQVIEPALQRDEVVLCDRFTDSSFAYQGGGQGLDLSVLATLEHWVQTGLVQKNAAVKREPDLTIWFDLRPEEAARRLAGVRVPDKFEAKDAAFFERASSAYLARATSSPARFKRVGADQPRTQVWAEVEQAVRARGWLQ